MRCLARNRNLKRCFKEGCGRFHLYCIDHKFQPFALLLTFFSILGLVGGLYQDIWRPTFESFVKHDLINESLYNKLIEDRKKDFPKVKYTGIIDNSMFEINCPIISNNTKNIFVEFEIDENKLPEVELIWIRVTRRKNNRTDSGGYIISNTQYLPRKGKQMIRLLNMFSDGYYRIRISIHSKRVDSKPYICYKECDYYFSNENNSFKHHLSFQ